MIFAVLKFLVISVCISAAISLGLIVSQPLRANKSAGKTLDFSGTINVLKAPLALVGVKMRDGYDLMTRQVSGPDEPAPLLVMVHGSGWHGQQFDRLAAQLGDVAEVLAPDLRGHGVAPARRGDVDYIGQLEDDLADLIKARRKPGQKLVMLGHSSGGGLVVRFAGGEHGAMLDGAVLLAPFLKYNAPTTRPNSGGWANVLIRRIIGLSMLNAAGIHLLDHLPVIQFAFPASVLDGPQGHTATTAYSWRMNTSYAPRADYLKDVAALPRFVLMAGQEDESFVASGYQPLMSAVTDKGQYRLIEGVNHLDVVDAAATEVAIREYLNEL